MTAARLSFLIVCVVLALLYILPDRLMKRTFTLEPGSPREVRKKFPLNIEFPVLRAQYGIQGKASLERIFQKHPGQTLIINLWATWCPPCLEELPSLEMLNQRLKKAGEKLPLLVTISVDEEAVAVDGLYRSLDFSPTFLVLHDRSGVFARQVGTTKFPETYWIDSAGTIIHKWLGPQDWLGSSVLELIGKKKHT